LPSNSSEDDVKSLADDLAKMWTGRDPSKLNLMGTFSESLLNITQILLKTRFGKRLQFIQTDSNIDNVQVQCLHEIKKTALNLEINNEKTHLISLINESLGFDRPSFYCGGAIPKRPTNTKKNFITLPSLLTLTFTRKEGCAVELPHGFDAGCYRRPKPLPILPQSEPCTKSTINTSKPIIHITPLSSYFSLHGFVTKSEKGDYITYTRIHGLDQWYRIDGYDVSKYDIGNMPVKSKGVLLAIYEMK
jgi:hypothetical protein